MDWVFIQYISIFIKFIGTFHRRHLVYLYFNIAHFCYFKVNYKYRWIHLKYCQYLYIHIMQLTKSYIPNNYLIWSWPICVNIFPSTESWLSETLRLLINVCCFRDSLWRTTSPAGTTWTKPTFAPLTKVLTHTTYPLMWSGLTSNIPTRRSKCFVKVFKCTKSFTVST